MDVDEKRAEREKGEEAGGRGDGVCRVSHVVCHALWVCALIVFFRFSHFHLISIFLATLIFLTLALSFPSLLCPSPPPSPPFSVVDLEGSLAMLVYLIPSRIALFSSSDVSASALSLARALSSRPDVRPAMRLRALRDLFNALEDASARFEVLRATLDFGERAGLQDLLLPSVRKGIDAWPAALGLSPAAERALQTRAASLCAGARRASKQGRAEARRLRFKVAEGVAEADGAEALREAAPATAALLLDLAAAPDALTFDVTSYPAARQLADAAARAQLVDAKALSQSQADAAAGALALLDAFAAADPAAVDAALGAHGAALAAHGVDADATKDKAKLLALVAACERAQDDALPYDDAAKAIGTAEGDDAAVERAVVAACARGALEARMDAVERLVRVQRAAPRVLDDAAWDALRAKLVAWRQTIDRVREGAGDKSALLLNGLSAIGA